MFYSHKEGHRQITENDPTGTEMQHNGEKQSTLALHCMERMKNMLRGITLINEPPDFVAHNVQAFYNQYQINDAVQKTVDLFEAVLAEGLKYMPANNTGEFSAIRDEYRTHNPTLPSVNAPRM